MQFISISTLFYCQGGFPDSPIHGDGVTSREGSLSDTEGESFRGSSTTVDRELETSSGSMIQNGGQSPSLSCTASRENGNVFIVCYSLQTTINKKLLLSLLHCRSLGLYTCLDCLLCVCKQFVNLEHYSATTTVNTLYCRKKIVVQWMWSGTLSQFYLAYKQVLNEAEGH